MRSELKSGNPKVSIIIRTYNEEKHLPALLCALSTQKNQDFETIVVDSGSLDLSRQIARKSGAKVLRINSHDFTFGYSLNIGIKEAKGSTWFLPLHIQFHVRKTGLTN